ncbi:hypothetical protein [Spiroplasma endosymbiont of Aspidapion aeneum]|uniref:hypothetical protein n=1 Tax=Spiroplasma endosymbiont of Aspidapion aeneum TaxID=3066276 RepID=UPI00313C571D
MSVKLIREILQDEPNLFKTAIRKKRRIRLSKKHNQYVKDDFIHMNYKTPNVVGVDGTNIKIFLEYKHCYKKFNCLISYIWENKKVLS